LFFILFFRKQELSIVENDEQLRWQLFWALEKEGKQQAKVVSNVKLCINIQIIHIKIEILNP
jgi:hypothetical protein